MSKESILKFLGTGMFVLPTILLLGTGSLDVVAMSLFVLLVMMLATLIIDPDDPIGDKLKAEAHEKDEPPQ